MEQGHWPRTRHELSEGPIQVRVATVEHLFNPMDPSPLGERSLDQEVADWIEEWAEDLDRGHPVDVEIYVADGRLDGREEAIISGLHHHFGYRSGRRAANCASCSARGGSASSSGWSPWPASMPCCA